MKNVSFRRGDGRFKKFINYDISSNNTKIIIPISFFKKNLLYLRESFCIKESEFVNFYIVRELILYIFFSEFKKFVLKML